MTATIKPAGRTLAEFQPLKLAEQKLLEACRQGTVARISDKRPEAANDNNIVRAVFLRFLALGGDEKAPVHEHGVQLAGAWIEGKLDMEAARVPSGLTIGACHFDITPVFHGAKIAGTLNLGGSLLPGLAGDRLACDGDLFLGQCFNATEEVWLQGAQIGGNLGCQGANLNGKDCALVADGASIKHSVYLNEGFTATGRIRLLSARIGGDLYCDSAKFDGKGGMALEAQGMVLEGNFFFQRLGSPANGVSLALSRIGHLADDAASWGEGLVLDGLTYDSISRGAPTDVATRLAWLDKQIQQHIGLNGDGAHFKPQPWRQLARVFREMGHAENARQVAIAFEHRLRKANLIGQTPKHWGKLRSWLYRKISRGGHWLFWVFTGYGYRPLRLLGWMFGVWLLCAMLYWYVALAGVFAPSNPLVFQNLAYAACKPDYVAPAPQGKAASAVPPAAQGAGNWYLCEKLPEEYSGFSPLAYSLDVILPLVDLQQETSWSPLIPTPKAVWYQELFSICDWKHFTRLVLWFEILFGWVSSLLLVAVVSGLTKRREE